MITIVGKMFNWKNQGLKHKSKSSRFKVQYSIFKERREKMIRGLREIEDVKDFTMIQKYRRQKGRKYFLSPILFPPLSHQER